MKKIIFIVLVALGVPTVGFSNNTLVISSSTISDTRDVRNFNSISSGGAMKVFIRFGDTESLRMEGDREAIENIVTEVKNSSLNISTKRQRQMLNYSRVSIYIVAKRLNALTLNGSGELRVENPFRSEAFKVVMNGSGSIKANGTFGSVTGTVNGSGNIKLDGNTNQASVVVNGSGRFDGSKFRANTLKSSVAGSGSITSGVKNSLSANLTGSGSINYIGDPQVTSKKIGSGRIRKV